MEQKSRRKGSKKSSNSSRSGSGKRKMKMNKFSQSLVMQNPQNSLSSQSMFDKEKAANTSTDKKNKKT